MDTENNIAAEFERLKRQNALLLRAVRISLALLLLTLAAACIQAVRRIPMMAEVLQDMGSGTAQPFATQLVMRHAGGLFLAAVLLAATGLGFLLSSRASGRGIIVATVVIVVLFVQWQITVSGIQSPLIQVLRDLGEATK